MPRIDAPTVAEHHARQRQALVSAARALLSESGQAPSMAAAGHRAGLARSSVYQYFSSSEDLLGAVVAEVFPDWTRQVQDRVGAADTPGEQVWAYIEATLDLMTGAEQSLARALTQAVEPQVLQGPMEQFHLQLQVPLRAALTALGEPEEAAVADLIDTMIVQASRGAQTRAENDLTCVTPRVQRDVALARLHRLLAGYLALS